MAKKAAAKAPVTKSKTSKKASASDDDSDVLVEDSFLVDALQRFFGDRKSTRLNSSHVSESRMPSSA